MSSKTANSSLILDTRSHLVHSKSGIFMRDGACTIAHALVVLPDEYYKFALGVPEGSRYFVYKEARSLYEVPTFINNAWRDPAFLSNIVGGGK